MDRIKVRVPATSANVGSGFDCAGIAFKLYDFFGFEKLSHGVQFEGFDEKYANETNLTYRAYKAVCDKIGEECAVKITLIKTNVPVSRGLGSSATLICAGAFAANRLYGNQLTKKEIFELCNEIEGHPDNVAPALYGGLCISVCEDGQDIIVKHLVSDDIYFTAIVPSFEVPTREARAVLPDTVSRADAVFNMSRTALLPYAFEKGSFELIKLVTQDKIHQQYRKKLFKNIDEIEAAAYSVGAVSFVISGAGSTCMCISKKPVARELNEIIKKLDNGWVAHALEVDNNGAEEV